MKAIGITRKIDPLGRISIPKELRRKMGIKENETSVEILVEDDMVILRKYEPACIFCGEAKDVINFKGKNICKSCLNELKK